MSRPDLAGQLRRSTIADVAALAGVDRAVVSRVINNDSGLSIRDSTRQRVLDAIAMLNYRPNAAARSLRTARTRTLGLLIPDFANPVYAEIVKGAERAAADVGSVLVAGSADGVGTTAATYLELLGHGRIDGLLVATGGLPQAQQDELARLHLPWLLINRRGRERRRYVILDDELAAALAVDHLISLGHRRIAHITGPRGADTAQRRRTGYTKTLRRAGISADPALTISADYTPDGGADAMHTLLQTQHTPTAVFVANVASAIGALHAAHELSLRVPDDISVVAVHDFPLAARLVPPLTTVRMPLDQLGQRAVQLLLRTPGDAEIREVVREPIDLVVRESTGAPPKG